MVITIMNVISSQMIAKDHAVAEEFDFCIHKQYDVEKVIT